MELAEYAENDAVGLGEMVHRGDVSAVELAHIAAAAVEALNPRLNAVLEVFSDRVEGLDESTLGDGPLRGVPFLLKDIGSGQIGRLQEAGLPLLEGVRVEEQHLLTANFEAAGLNIIGRTAVPPFGFSFDTTSALHGVTGNPWNLDRTPGGSSGGAAAAVAAGIVPMAHASDSAGSIRVPAGLTGLVGLKTTRGRIPMPQINELAFHTAQEGVVSRTVRDTAVALDWMQRSKPGYSAVPIRPPNRPYRQEVGASTGRLRIALSVGAWGRDGEVEDCVAESVHDAARTLEALGHDVVEVPDEDIVDFPSFWETFILGRGWLAGMTWRRVADEMGLPADASMLGPVLSKSLAWSETISAAELVRSLEANQTISIQVARLFERFDVLVCPVMAIGAPTAGGEYSALADEPVEPWTAKVYDACRYTPLGNETGIPGLSLPAGFDDAGVPVGVQLYAPWGREDLLIRLASRIEDARPGLFSRKPPIHVAAGA